PYDAGPFTVSDGMVKVTIDGQKFNIVDTPGIFDTTKPDEEVFREIAKAVQKCAYGVKAILFVFGDNALEYLIAVFSHATKKQNADKDEMRKAWTSEIASFIGSFYTSEKLESARQAQEKIMREKEKEERRIKAEYEEKLRKEGKEKADRDYREEMNRMKAEYEQRQKRSLEVMANDISKRFDEMTTQLNNLNGKIAQLESEKRKLDDVKNNRFEFSEIYLISHLGHFDDPFDMVKIKFTNPDGSEVFPSTHRQKELHPYVQILETTYIIWCKALEGIKIIGQKARTIIARQITPIKDRPITKLRLVSDCEGCVEGWVEVGVEVE
ncbi:2502_t:CDS:2, partial [Racocetra fulgida]